MCCRRIADCMRLRRTAAGRSDGINRYRGRGICDVLGGAAGCERRYRGANHRTVERDSCGFKPIDIETADNRYNHRSSNHCNHCHCYHNGCGNDHNCRRNNDRHPTGMGRDRPAVKMEGLGNFFFKRLRMRMEYTKMLIYGVVQPP